MGAALATAPVGAPAPAGPILVPREQPATPGACELEVSRGAANAWALVLRFDAASEAELHFVRHGVESLALVDARARFRVVLCAAERRTLYTYALREGWREC
jgi:hypothetical protein